MRYYVFFGMGNLSDVKERNMTGPGLTSFDTFRERVLAELGETILPAGFDWRHFWNTGWSVREAVKEYKEQSNEQANTDW